MTGERFQLAHAPIVEAVLDLDCDLPAGQDIGSLEHAALAAYHDRYPKMRTQFIQGLQIDQPLDGEPSLSTHRAVQAFQFLTDDEKQLVQVRAQGYSFNRLAPYVSLDEYLPEIERAWLLYVGIANPLQVREVRLRYINRILVPLRDDVVDLDDYFTIAPRLPDETRLSLSGFLDQHAAIENETGNTITIILNMQPTEGEHIPVVLDVQAVRTESIAIDNWDRLLGQVQSLRALKNDIFRKSLTPQCLELFA
jgi:uncharacterized protein (TIGR04255 family)